MINRRVFLLGGTLLAGSSAWYAYNRGLRYPRMTLEPDALASTARIANTVFSLKDTILTAQAGMQLRAISPEPSVTIETLEPGTINFSVNNIAIESSLMVTGRNIKCVEEQVVGITRHIRIECLQAQSITLTWMLPRLGGFDFAIIGDTGGEGELDWTLHRAHELGALFLLHLGDFNYGNNEYELAIQKFHKANLPCYISIGNHDFNDDGLIFKRFLNQLGPMNHSFELEGTRFVNVDTAADYFPAHAGQRGDLIRSLQDQSQMPIDYVFFSHSPLRDPRPQDDHEVGGIGEVDWLVQNLRSMNAKTWLNGHVHHSAELEVGGVKQWTAGEGLGHENLIHQKPVAQMLMGRVETGQKVSFRWVDLAMPWSAHQNHTHQFKLKRDGRKQQLEWYLSLRKDYTGGEQS